MDLPDPKAPFLSKPEKIRRFDILRQLVARSPVGWHDGKLIHPRSVSEQDVIQWLCDVMNLCGIDENGDAAEVERVAARLAEKTPSAVTKKP